MVLFREIYRFHKLNLIALWIDMLRTLVISLLLTLTSLVTCKDYLQEATQKGLDYGMEIYVHDFCLLSNFNL